MKPLFHLTALCAYLLLVYSSLSAQTYPSRDRSFSGVPLCGADLALHKLWRDRPEMRKFNHAIDTMLAGRTGMDAKKHPGTLNEDFRFYEIPVVVHIVHNGGAENISDAQILDGIRYINKAFERLGTNDRSAVSFSLCMAKQDDMEKPTTGITRTQSALTGMDLESDDLALKNLIRWDPTKYINIWIVRDIATL